MKKHQQIDFIENFVTSGDAALKRMCSEPTIALSPDKNPAAELLGETDEDEESSF